MGILGEYLLSVFLFILFREKKRVLTWLVTITVKGKSKAKPVEEDDEEEELRKLQAEMAM